METDVEIRHNGAADLMTGFGGLLTLTFGLALGWMRLQDPELGLLWVAAVSIILLGFGLIGHCASSRGDRSVRLTINPSGLTDHRRRRTFRWADVRRARLLISKPGNVLLDAVLELTVEEAGISRPRRISLMRLDLDPEKVAELVQIHVLPTEERSVNNQL